MITTAPIVGFVPFHGERLLDDPATGLDPLDALVAPGDESAVPRTRAAWACLDHDVDLHPGLALARRSVPPRDDEHPER